MNKPTMDQVIEAYVNTREAIRNLEEDIAKLKVYQARREEYMGELLTESGVDSMKAKHGTVYTMIAESVTVGDPETFFNWVIENNAFECLEKRAAKTAVLELMGDREDSGRPNPPPPGLNYSAVRKIGVRKA